MQALIERKALSAGALVLFIILSSSHLLKAQEQDVSDPPPESSSKKLVVLPLLYYTPETRLAFGAGGVFTFRPEVIKKSTRPTSVWMYVVYTLNKQIQAMVKPEVYSINNIYVLNGTLSFVKFPQKFYGIGSEAPESAEELYTPQTVLLEISAKRKLFRSLYGGVEYGLETTKILAYEADGALGPGDLPGSRGGLVSGVGLSLSWDSRDNILFPRRGQHLQLSAGLYHKALGSNFNFSRIALDLRAYIQAAKRHVLAIQAYLSWKGGDPPLNHLSLLGGDSLMRGYYKGRYRDKGILAIQAEYRLPVWKRIGLAAFAGAGDVFDRIGNLRLSGLKYSYGGGIRFQLDPKEGTNLRMDIAGGKNSFGLYFTATESF